MPVIVWKGALMPSVQPEDKSGFFEPLLLVLSKAGSVPKRGTGVRAPLLACLLILALTSVVWSQGAYQVEGGDQVHQRRTDQFDHITETLTGYGKIFLKVAGVVLLGILALKIIPNLYYHAGDRALKRALRNVDELLKKIRAEAETVSADAEEETETEEEPPLEGLLAGMTEIAEMNDADEVPAYILTVNDLSLDDVGITLKRLRRFRDGSAEKYKNSMLSVITGIKTISEQSAASGAASGLAVDLHEYFEDDRRYHAWKKTLAYYAKRREYHEPAQGFLMFMKNLKQGRPLTVPEPTTRPLQERPVPAILEDTVPEIPDTINEETLPLIQRAARKEARKLCAQVRKDRQLEGDEAWQFELVGRQQQVHLRKESQRMLMVFLNYERKVLQKITKSKMLPCRTWEHILHMLGVKTMDQLLGRIEDKLLTVQEISILEKAFLQTFAKMKSLQQVYGAAQGAGVMIDLHIPQIRQEALVSLRRLHQADLERLDKATESLNQEETPQHNEVKRLVMHYIHRGNAPPDISKSEA